MSDAIWIQMYHNRPPVPEISEQGNEVPWCIRVWDPFFATNVMYATGALKLNEGYSSESLKPIMHKVVADKDMPDALDADMIIFKLLGPREQMISLADSWADHAIHDCDTVGGDDTYFDYYPDFLDGLGQLCKQIDYPSAINRAVAYAKATTYADDDEGTLDNYEMEVDREPSDIEIYGAGGA